MKAETFKEILDWTQALHQQLAACLAHCSTEHQSQHAKWLMTYLADHEAVLADTVARLTSHTETHVLNTWIVDYIDHQPIDPHRACDKPFISMTFEQISETVFDLHNQVIDLYQHLVSRADIPQTRGLLNELLEIEQHETMRLAQTLLQQRISALPVLDDRERVVGIGSEGDLVRRAETDPGHKSSWWLSTIADPDSQASAYAKAHHIKRVQALRHGALVGIVSRANLLHGVAVGLRRSPLTGVVQSL